MKNMYLFDYINENEFKKLERSLKKYNMLAFKKLYFDYYPLMKNGTFVGELIDKNDIKETRTYSALLPTDIVFAKVHGDIKLIYHVYDKQNTVMLDTILPDDIFTEGHQSELVTYKGVMVSKSHSDKDIFKINLLNMLGKQ